MLNQDGDDIRVGCVQSSFAWEFLWLNQLVILSPQTRVVVFMLRNNNNCLPI